MENHHFQKENSLFQWVVYPVFQWVNPLFQWENSLFQWENPLFQWENPLFQWENPLFQESTAVAMRLMLQQELIAHQNGDFSWD